jgi:hypothetical protein
VKLDTAAALNVLFQFVVSANRIMAGPESTNKLVFAFYQRHAKRNHQKRAGKATCLSLNPSNIFARSDLGVKTGTWYAGSIKLISETPLQMYNSVLRGFNMKNDLLGGTSS